MKGNQIESYELYDFLFESLIDRNINYISQNITSEETYSAFLSVKRDVTDKFLNDVVMETNPGFHLTWHVTLNENDYTNYFTNSFETVFYRRYTYNPVFNF